jgi:hypothetical protein
LLFCSCWNLPWDSCYTVCGTSDGIDHQEPRHHRRLYYLGNPLMEILQTDLLHLQHWSSSFNWKCCVGQPQSQLSPGHAPPYVFCNVGRGIFREYIVRCLILKVYRRLSQRVSCLELISRQLRPMLKIPQSLELVESFWVVVLSKLHFPWHPIFVNRRSRLLVFSRMSLVNLLIYQLP